MNKKRAEANGIRHSDLVISSSGNLVIEQPAMGYVLTGKCQPATPSLVFITV